MRFEVPNLFYKESDLCQLSLLISAADVCFVTAA